MDAMYNVINSRNPNNNPSTKFIFDKYCLIEIYIPKSTYIGYVPERVVSSKELNDVDKKLIIFWFDLKLNCIFTVEMQRSGL